MTTEASSLLADHWGDPLQPDVILVSGHTDVVYNSPVRLPVGAHRIDTSFGWVYSEMSFTRRFTPAYVTASNDHRIERNEDAHDNYDYRQL